MLMTCIVKLFVTNQIKNHIPLKRSSDQKIHAYFPLDFKTMSTKHQVTQVLSLDFKVTCLF